MEPEPSQFSDRIAFVYPGLRDLDLHVPSAALTEHTETTGGALIDYSLSSGAVKVPRY